MPNSNNSSLEDLSMLGDNTTLKPPKLTQNTTITLEQIEALLDRKLNNIKQSLLDEVKSAITSVTTCEIMKLKEEIFKTTNGLVSEQEKLKKEIESMNTVILHMKTESLRLQKEIQNIQNKINTNKWENGFELHERIVHAFQEILNVNIQGYVEDIKRLGKKGYRRPLQIELLSKNLTRQILYNRRLFKGTGLAVSEVLGTESLINRKKLIDILIDARRKGHRANIINNKLIINGKEYKPNTEPTSLTLNQTSSNIETPDQNTLQKQNCNDSKPNNDFFRT